MSDETKTITQSLVEIVDLVKIGRLNPTKGSQGVILKLIQIVAKDAMKVRMADLDWDAPLTDPQRIERAELHRELERFGGES